MQTIKISDVSKNKIAEKEIIRRIISGEKELYELLIRRNNQKLYRLIRSYIKREAEIEDIMQDTYLKAYEKLFQFKHDSAFSTWLIRIGINETLARLRSNKRMFHIDSDRQYEEGKTIMQLADVQQLNPEKKNDQKGSKTIYRGCDRCSG